MRPARFASLEAAIYLGKDAKRAGLIDDVMSYDDAILGLDVSETVPPPAPAPNEGNVTDRRAKEKASVDTVGTRKLSSTQRGTPTEAHMGVKLDALIKKTEAAIAVATDAKALRSLQSSLASYVATRAELDNDKDDDKKKDDSDDDGDEDSKSAKAAEQAAKAKKTAEAAKHRAKAAEHKQKAAEYEEAAKKAEEDDEDEEEESEESEASLTPGKVAALASQADMCREALARVEALDKSSAAPEHAPMIAEAKAQRRITPTEAKTLPSKSLAFVRDYLEMRPKSLVNTADEELSVPDGREGADIGAAAMGQVERAVAVWRRRAPTAAARERPPPAPRKRRRPRAAAQGTGR